MPQVIVNECVYIYAVVDSTDVVAETDETNNQSTTNSAAVVLVYDDENGARTYTLFFETYPPTGTIIGNDPDTEIRLYDDSGTWIFTQDGTGIEGAYERKTEPNITPGIYWVMIWPYGPSDGPYAFSVRTANIDRKTFSSDLSSNAEDLEEEAINHPPPPPAGGWGDVGVIKVGAASNRYSDLNDADWFKIVLP